MKLNADLQNQWADQQVREKKAAADQERHEEMQYAMQTDTITRMRGMLEDEMNEKRAAMNKAI